MSIATSQASPSLSTMLRASTSSTPLHMPSSSTSPRAATKPWQLPGPHTTAAQLQSSVFVSLLAALGPAGCFLGSCCSAWVAGTVSLAAQAARAAKRGLTVATVLCVRCNCWVGGLGLERVSHAVAGEDLRQLVVLCWWQGAPNGSNRADVKPGTSPV